MTTTPWSSAPPAPLAPPASLQVDRPADVAVLAACAISAVGADLAGRAGLNGLAAATVPVIACVGLVATRRFPNRQARALLAVAPVLTAFLAVRTSDAAVVPAFLAAALLVALAAGLARGGDLLDLTFPGLVGRLALTTTHGFLAPAFVVGPLVPVARRSRWMALGRGVAIGLPVVAGLTALLASADAVFASLLRRPDPRDLALHAVLLGFGACVGATLLRHASARTSDLPLGEVPPLGAVEARVVLGGLCGVFAAFSVAQVVVALGAADRILSQDGLTYAQYARTGFFQLLVAAGLTAVVLLCLRACAPRGDRIATGLALLVVALTEVVVAVAVHRLFLYEDAYGLTLLRLAATGAAMWIGVVFLLVGLAWAGVGAGRSWLPGAVLGLALVGLLAWNLADPAALVARRDLDRARVDPAHLASLGDDAVPTIVARLDHLDPATRTELAVRICATAPGRRSLLGWNHAASRAASARHTLGC